MTELMKRAAAAVEEAAQIDWDHKIVNPEEVALAVIKALRLDPAEQSDACSTDIVDAGRNAWMEWEIGPDDFKRANAATVDSWNAMLAAALGKEG